LDAGREIGFTPGFAGNGIYLFVIEGAVTVDGQRLEKRDAVGISQMDSFAVRAEENAELLAIEVPMFA
jgi:hypothetical protein